MKHEIRKDGELIATIETHGDAVVVIHEPQPEVQPEKPDYSHLVGKWMRCSWGEYYGKWVKFLGKTNGLPEIFNIEVDGCRIEHLHISWLDLSNPRDTNPDEEERVIEFDIERWRKGDYVAVKTRDGREVTQLTEFKCESSHPIGGVLEDIFKTWKATGELAINGKNNKDLMLVVKGGQL